MTLTSIDKHELLATHFLFRDLEPDLINHITKLSVSRKLDKNEVLFLKGDPGDALYGVLSGRIKISTSSPGGKEIILSIVDPGNIFGEIALLDGKARTADASSVGCAELFKINRREFIDFIDGQPKLITHLLEMVCDRIRSSNEFVEDYVFLELPERLAKRLLSLGGFYGKDETPDKRIELHISQVELGQLMGTSREAINRQLQIWRKNGWIEVYKGRVDILSAKDLQHLVDINEK